MPSEAFMKLSEDKRNKIINAMKKEFGRTEIEKTSVERIIKDAGISKGSFWVYFENKSEAIDYLTKRYMEDEINILKKELIKNKGDIFEASVNMYVYLIGIRDAKVLIGNIIQNIITRQDRCFIDCKEKPKNEIEDVFNIIDMSNMKFKQREYLFTLTKMVIQSIRTNALAVILNKVSEEEATRNLEREFMILKEGVLIK